MYIFFFFIIIIFFFLPGNIYTVYVIKSEFTYKIYRGSLYNYFRNCDVNVQHAEEIKGKEWGRGDK